jgi:hypothetical protein
LLEVFLPRSTLYWALVALVLAPAILGAQVPPRPEDVSTLDGIIRAYYDVVSGPAGSLPDPARDATLHHPDARITMLDRRADGTATAAVITLEGYYQRTGTGPRKAGFFEREIHRVTQRVGALVHVWSTYESSTTPGGKAFSRGVNSIQLYWDGKRWWIVGWIFDDERHGTRVPAEYLPR